SLANRTPARSRPARLRGCLRTGAASPGAGRGEERTRVRSFAPIFVECCEEMRDWTSQEQDSSRCGGSGAISAQPQIPAADLAASQSSAKAEECRDVCPACPISFL